MYKVNIGQIPLDNELPLKCHIDSIYVVALIYHHLHNFLNPNDPIRFIYENGNDLQGMKNLNFCYNSICIAE